MDLQHALNIAVPIAIEATDMMGRMFAIDEGDLHMEFKAEDGDTAVTIIDKTVGNFIVGKLAAQFPDHDVWDEDAATRIERGSPWQWNSDPVDGTRNLQFQIEQSVIGINLNYEGKAVLSIVGNPFEETLTYATKGGGAFVCDLDGKYPFRIRVDKDKAWNQKLFAIDSNFAPKAAPRKLKAIELISKHAQHMGSFGSNLYHWSLLAQGRAHYVLTDTVGGFWDIAAHLIVTEAGGKATGMSGNEPVPGCQAVFGSTGDDKNHEEILAELTKFYEGYKGFR